MALVVRKDQPPKMFAGGGDVEVEIKQQALMILGILESRPSVLVLVGDATHLPPSNK